MGTDLDRSKYASSSSDEEPPALRHNRGKDSNVVLQCWQTTVALTKSRSVGKNVAMRASVSGGIWSIGARQFLILFAFLSIVEIFKIVSSIWINRGQ